MPAQEPPSYVEQRNLQIQDTRRERYLERSLPSSEDAERAVLGFIQVMPDLMAEVASALLPEHFYSQINRRVYSAMLRIFAVGGMIDPIMIIEELKREGPIDSIGGVSTIANLAFGLPGISVMGLRPYIDTILDKSRSRELIRACNDILTEALAEEDIIEYVLERAEQSIHQISDSGAAVPTVVSAHSVAVGVIANAQEIAHNPGQMIGMTTGFTELDTQTLGFQNSDEIIIAARPSMGKTALLLDIFRHASFHQGHTTLLFSLEMSKEQLVQRLLCQEAGINSQRLRTGMMTSEEWDKINEARERFETGQLLIDDTPALTTTSMHRKIRRTIKTHGKPRAVAVDYIGLMRGDYSRGKRYESRQNEVAEISRDLKLMAKEFDCPMIALSQLNRQPEARQANSHRPNMGDLRDSGAIEQDADVVLFVYREEMYPKPDGSVLGQGEAEIIIGKQRNGPTGTVKLQYSKDYTRFGNLQSNF